MKETQLNIQNAALNVGLFLNIFCAFFWTKHVKHNFSCTKKDEKIILYSLFSKLIKYNAFGTILPCTEQCLTETIFLFQDSIIIYLSKFTEGHFYNVLLKNLTSDAHFSWDVLWSQRSQKVIFSSDLINTLSSDQSINELLCT